MTSQEEYMLELEKFADFVARTVCTEEFRQSDAEWFAEHACWKLLRLGFVKMNEGKWLYKEVDE